MANSDHSTEQEAETNTPSTSYVPASTETQSLQTGASPIGNIHESELCKLTEDLSLQQLAVTPVQEQKETELPLEPLFTNVSQSVNNELPTLGTENPSPKKRRRKNAKKKERLKKLQMPQPNEARQQMPQPNEDRPSPPDFTLPNNVKELFNRHMPVYATQSHYLENLSHHPQYQFMQNRQMMEMYQQHAASVPNSPLVQLASFNTGPHPEMVRRQMDPSEMYQQQPHNAASVPNSPLVQLPSFNTGHHAEMVHRQMDPHTTRYLQNMMQHPLLNKSYSVDSYKHYQQQQLLQQQLQWQTTKKNEDYKQSKTNKHRNRTKSNDNKNNDVDYKFGYYLPIEEVEQGLKNKTLIEGVLRINPKQFTHAYISSKDRDEQDVLIDGIKHRNRALEGDVVVVEIVAECDDNVTDTENDAKKGGKGKDNASNSSKGVKNVKINSGKVQNSNTNENKCDVGNVNDTEAKPAPDDKQKRGRVVFIKEKVHTRTCIGILKLMPDKNRQKALFVPRDHRIPRLNIPFTSWPNNFYKEAKSFENTLFLAKIVDWFDSRFATGKIIENIGQTGDMVTETKAILAQNDLDVTPYGQEYNHLYPKLDYTIPDDEIKMREDCRKLCIFSIDPSSCRDIDDAVSCRKLENGNYEIGVHISDVGHYLTEGTDLDKKVAEKATTIYLVDKAYHMLPDELCMLCSLFPGVDKLAFSVFWEITDNAEVLSHRFAKTVIHSCCQLAYEHAQAILEDKDEADFPEIYNGFQYKDIYETIKTLGKVAAKFRHTRFENGALRIDQPKVAFHLDPFNGLPKSFWIYESKESHQLIEEFMLLANMTVAERIYNDHPNLAFLRCHPPPSKFMLKQLATSLKPMGIDLEIQSAGGLQGSLLPYVGPDNADKGRAMVLSMLCAKPMARAKYFCADGVDDDDFHHYALNVPLYTHFTSPIRRYADIMVHRLLTASLQNCTPKWEVDIVRMVAAQCNKQKYNAKKAGELSTELYTLKYIEMHSPIVTEAVVVDVRDKYLDVIVVAMGLNRRVYFNSDFPGEFTCVKSDAGARLSRMEVEWHIEKDAPNAPEVKQVIEVFSIVQIEMRKGDDMAKVETRLVKPQPTVN